MKGLCIFFGVFALIGLSNVPLAAQTVDFSGTWSLNRDASTVPEFQGRRRGAERPAILVITHDTDQIVIAEGQANDVRSFTYFLDGRESYNENGPATLTTMSSWNGTTLVTQGSAEISTPRGDFIIQTEERRTISDDGQTMTVESTRRTPRGNRQLVLVYQKES